MSVSPDDGGSEARLVILTAVSSVICEHGPCALHFSKCFTLVIAFHPHHSYEVGGVVSPILQRSELRFGWATSEMGTE